MKEIKTLEKDNNQEMLNAQRQRQNEIVAAWKIRYYIEYLRLISTQHIVNVIEEKNHELEQDASKMRVQVATIKHDLEDQKILQQRSEMTIETLQHEKKELQRIIDNLHIDLDSTNHELQRKCEQLIHAGNNIQQEKAIQREDLAKYEILKSELNITRLTCQEMVKNNAHKDSLIDEMELKIKHLHGIIESSSQELLLVREEHTKEMTKLREEKRQLEGKLDEKYAMEEEITSRDYTIQELQEMMKDQEKTIEEHVKTIDKLALQVKDEQSARESEQEIAINEKDSLQRVMTDLAIQLKACQEELAIQLDKVTEHEGVENTLREEAQGRDAIIQDLEAAVEEANHEIDFLVTENEELAREIECYTMKSEENDERYRLLHINHQRGIEYRTYLEEELYAARHISAYNNQNTMSNNAPNPQMAAAIAAATAVTGGEFDGGFGSTVTAGTGNTEDDASQVSFSNFPSASRSELISRSALGGPPGRLGSFSSTTSNISPEQKLVSIVNILEEKMNSMDKAANALKAMMEKAESLERTQANRRHTIQQQRLQQPPVESENAIAAAGSPDANVTAGQTLSASPSEEGKGSEKGTSVNGDAPVEAVPPTSAPTEGEGEKPTSPLPTTPVMSEEEAAALAKAIADAEAEALAKAKEEQEKAYAAEKARRQVFLDEYNQMEEAYIEIQASIEEINKELIKQRDDIKTLQELRNKFKQDIALWKKNFKKANRREATEEEKEKELSEYMTQMNLIRDQINAYKTSNLTLNAKAIALQTELNHLAIELEESGKDFKKEFNLDIIEFSLRHLKLNKDDKDIDNDLDAILSGVGSGSRPTTTTSVTGRVGVIPESETEGEITDVESEKDKEKEKESKPKVEEVPKEEGKKNDANKDDATKSMALAISVENIYPIPEVPAEEDRPSTAPTAAVAPVDAVVIPVEKDDEFEVITSRKNSVEKPLSASSGPKEVVASRKNSVEKPLSAGASAPSEVVAPRKDSIQSLSAGSATSVPTEDVAPRKASIQTSVPVIASPAIVATVAVVATVENQEDATKSSQGATATLSAVGTATTTPVHLPSPSAPAVVDDDTSVVPNSNEIGEESVESQPEDDPKQQALVTDTEDELQIKGSSKSGKSSKSKKEKSKKDKEKSKKKSKKSSSTGDDTSASDYESNTEEVEAVGKAIRNKMQAGNDIDKSDSMSTLSMDPNAVATMLGSPNPNAFSPEASTSVVADGSLVEGELSLDGLRGEESIETQGSGSPANPPVALSKTSKSKSKRNKDLTVSLDAPSMDQSDADAEQSDASPTGKKPKKLKKKSKSKSSRNAADLVSGDDGGQTTDAEGGVMNHEYLGVEPGSSLDQGSLYNNFNNNTTSMTEEEAMMMNMMANQQGLPPHLAAMMAMKGQSKPGSPQQVPPGTAGQQLAMQQQQMQMTFDPMTGTWYTTPSHPSMHAHGQGPNSPGHMTAGGFYPGAHPMMYNPYDPRFYSMQAAAAMGMPMMGMNPFFPGMYPQGMYPGANPHAAAGYNPYNMPYGPNGMVPHNMMGMMEGDTGSLDGMMAMGTQGMSQEGGSLEGGAHVEVTASTAPADGSAVTVGGETTTVGATDAAVAGTVTAGTDEVIQTDSQVLAATIAEPVPSVTVAAAPVTEASTSQTPMVFTTPVRPGLPTTSARAPGSLHSKKNAAKGLQSAQHQQRSHSHQLHQQLRLKLAKLKGEMETLYAEVNDYVEEIEGLEATRGDVRQEIVTWHAQFYDVNGYLAEDRDKLRSKVYPPLQRAFLDTQEELEKKYQVAVPALANAQSKLEELIQMQDQARSLSVSVAGSTASAMKVENFAELYKLPDSSLFVYRYEDPDAIIYDPDAIEEEADGYDALTAALSGGDSAVAPVEEKIPPTTAASNGQGEGLEETETIGPLQSDSLILAGGGSIGTHSASASPSRKGSNVSQTAGVVPASSPSVANSRKGSSTSIGASANIAAAPASVAASRKGSTTSQSGDGKISRTPSKDAAVTGKNTPGPEASPQTASATGAATPTAESGGKMWKPPSKPGLHNSDVLIPDMNAYWAGFDVIGASNDSRPGSQSKSRDYYGAGESGEPAINVIGNMSMPTSRAMTPGSAFAATAPLSPIPDSPAKDTEKEKTVEPATAIVKPLDSPDTINVRRKYSEAFTASLFTTLSFAGMSVAGAGGVGVGSRVGTAASAPSVQEGDEGKGSDDEKDGEGAKLDLSITGKAISLPPASSTPVTKAPSKADDEDFSFLDSEVPGTPSATSVATAPVVASIPAPFPAPTPLSAPIAAAPVVAPATLPVVGGSGSATPTPVVVENKPEPVVAPTTTLAPAPVVTSAPVPLPVVTPAPAPAEAPTPAPVAPAPAPVVAPPVKPTTAPTPSKPSRKNRKKNDDDSSASESEGGASYAYNGPRTPVAVPAHSEIVDPSLFTDMSSSPAVAAAAKQTNITPLNVKPVTPVKAEEEDGEDGDKLGDTVGTKKNAPPPRDPKKTVYGHLHDYDLFKEDPAAAVAAATTGKATASPSGLAPVPIGVTLHDLVSAPPAGSSNISDTASVGSNSRLGSASRTQRGGTRNVSFDDQPAPPTTSGLKTPVTKPTTPMALVNRLSTDMDAPSNAPITPAPPAVSSPAYAAPAPVPQAPVTPGPIDTATAGDAGGVTPSEMLAADRSKMGSRSGSRGGSRPTTADGMLLSEYNQLKKDLKKWKGEFVAANGREPTVADFNDLDHALKVKIARKNQLKKILGDTANSSMSSRKSKRPSAISTAVSSNTMPIDEEEM